MSFDINMSSWTEDLPKTEKALHIYNKTKNDTMKFFRLFLGEPATSSLKLKPSVYLREMMLSSDQRIEQLNKLTQKYNFANFLSDNSSLKGFKITPPVVIFQSFHPGKQYMATVTVCNVSEASKLIGIKSKPSDTFSVSYLSKVTSKLAPGISIHFLVKFSPVDDQDYSDCLILETDGCSFNIPLAALGPRPLVNFPDFVDLKETLVKIPSKKTIFVKNIGQLPATFNIACEKPFSVSPDRYFMEIGQIVMITIQVESDLVDDFSKKMFITFESGEELCVDLAASTKNGNVWLDTKHIGMDDTFMGLKQEQKVTLYNDTDQTVMFSWHQYESQGQDMEQFERLKEVFEKVKINETVRCVQLEYNDIITEDNHAKVYSRMLKDQVQLLSPKDFCFHHRNFEIIPLDGQLWPGGRIQMSVVFSPHTVGPVSCSAYCDVTGVAHRLALQMSGRGLGPVVQLNLRSLDIGPIFLGLTQCYEIVAANKGDIPCRIQHEPTKTVFGGVLTIQPTYQCLLPYEMKSFIISFCSGRTGSFVEDVLFKVTQSDEVLRVMLKGSVVNPTISFDCAKLDFGSVAVGYPKTMSIGLVNQSRVPVEFALRVPSDGKELPVTCEQFASLSHKPKLATYCNEFTISPDSGVVEPNTTLEIQVTLITNTERKHAFVMVAENKNSKLLECISLSLVYESHVATVTCEPPQLILRFSFINYEYTADVTLTNTSTLPAYFYFPPQNQFGFNNILYTTDVTEAELQPNESIVVNVKIVPINAGRVNQDIMVLLFGRPAPAPLCSISCSVQGPNVSSNVRSLEYGKMTLMDPKTLTFELSNDSPISAFYVIFVEERAQSKWTVEPMSGTLGPEESVTVSVTLQVLDPGVIASTLSIQVENGRVISVELSASATGCGITFEPNIFPEIDLGYLFSRRLHQFVLTIHNPGSRHHFITFVLDRLSVISTPSHLNLFRLNPNKIDLVGGGKAQVVLECQSTRELSVVEAYSCVAIVNKRGVKQNLGNFLIKASFVSPMVEVSEQLLEFEINIGPGDKQGVSTTKLLTIKSVACLPVTMILELSSPFFILENDEHFYESVIELEPNEEAEVVVGFNPSIQESLVSVVYDQNLLITYKEHPQKDKIVLKGMLNFPNLNLSQHSLDFGCISLDSHAFNQVFMVNPTPLPVTFEFFWDPKSVVVVFFEQENIEEIVGPEYVEQLKVEDSPVHHSSHVGSVADKESVSGPVPLAYVEPVTLFKDHSVTVGENQEDIALSEEEMKEVHTLLFPLVQPYFRPGRLIPEFSILPESPFPKPVVSQVFDLSPMFGTVPPYQSQVLNVAFRPQQFMGVAATAVCSVMGGPTETISLSGQSARHIFTISTTFINFGFRVFMESCEEIIKITNLSQLPFHFKVFSPASIPLTLEVYDVQVGCLSVEPSYGYVPGQGSTAISVRFHPGLTGEFRQQFNIQIGYLEPVQVLVTGYGVLPQVAADCPHISRPKVPIGWGYQAVASLTAKRFTQLVAPIEATDLPELDHSDWEVVCCLEKVPSDRDIWLALERVIAYNYIKENCLSLFRPGDTNKRLFYQCLTPGYLLDLGSVVLGTTTTVSVMIENRGLVRCDVKLVLPMAEKKLKQSGFFVSFQNHVGLPVGKSVTLDIIIKPTSQKYLSKEEAVHLTFYLQVACGATVPLYFKALFTVPYITVDCAMLDFGTVQCGQCKKICLLLKNSGAVRAEWSISMIAIKRKKQGKVVPEDLVRFSVNQIAGLFQPKTAELLEIGFAPMEERFYETTLKIDVKHNPESVSVRLCGFGIEPKITVTPKTVQFGTHVPFSGPIKSTFTIANPCPFNVQVYFPDFDRDIINEDKILRFLTNYYYSDNLLLPLETYDKVPSPELQMFYEQVKNEVSAELRLRELKSKGLHSDVTSLPGSVDISHPKLNRKKTISSWRSTARSLINHPEFILDPLTQSRVDEDVTSQPDSGEVLHPKLSRKKAKSSWRSLTRSLMNHQESISDPLPHSKLDELEKCLLELLNEPDNVLQLSSDPLSLEYRCSPHVPDETRDDSKGVLYVFHGAPHSDFQYWANKTGRVKNLKVTTLDDLILREAASSERVAAVIIQEAINNVSEESTGSGVSYEELCERIAVLKTAKELIIPVVEDKKKVPGKKLSSSRPVTAKKGEIPNSVGTFNDISIQTFVELLSGRILEEVEKGLVLETLTGFFLQTVSSAVNVILGCVSHTNCLHFFSLFGTLEMHEEKIRKSLEKKDQHQMELNKKKFLELDLKTGEELEQVSYSDKLMYQNIVVEERRKWLKEFQGKRKTSAVSPQTTVASKKTGKKSSLKSPARKGSQKTKKSQKTEKKSSSEVASTKMAVVGNTSEAFEKYELELQELVFLLSRWNKDKAEFEDLDNPSSLFNMKKQSKPQSRKGKEVLKKTSDSGVHYDASVGVSCIIIVLKSDKLKSNDLMKFIKFHDDSCKPESTVKEWWNVPLPEPLILSTVRKPDIRRQNDKTYPFSVIDYKNNDEDISRGDAEMVRTEQYNDSSTVSVSQGETDPLKRTQQPKSMVSEDSLWQESNLEKTSLSTRLEIDNTEDKEGLDDKRVTKSLMSNEENAPISGRQVLTSRVELAPGEKRTWSVIFDPEYTGSYYQQIQLEVAGWRRQYQVVVEATCHIPMVDTNPAAMFEKVLDTLSPTSISQCVYLIDQNIFYFGPVFATPANEQRTNDLTTNFYFTNISATNIEMELAFMDSKSSNKNLAFGFKPNQLHILPGETKALEVFACPTTIGVYRETLVYSMLNNAKPGFIEMSCIGVKPDFEFEPKEIRFERVLLYNKEFSELTLSNKCYKPLGWRLVDLPLLSKQISVSQQSGVIQAMQSASVYINFVASYVELAKQVIYIEVYDDQFRGSPFVSEPITVSLESVDVLVDVMFPAGCEDSELKFQSVKVGEPESQVLMLKNLGKYDVTFSIRFNEDCKLSFNPEQVFTFTPKSGILHKMEKSAPVKITCMCTKLVRLTKAPVFKVWLVDTGPGAQPVAAIPINVTISAFSSQYRVFPQPELNFSSMLVGTRKVEHLVVENIGKFEFAFQILFMEQLQTQNLELQQAVPPTKLKSKDSAQSFSRTGKDKGTAKGKGKKKDSEPSLTVGAFTLSHSEGRVMPGQSFNIDVECHVPTQGTFCEEVVVRVLEYAWMKKEGTHVKLKAVSYLPFINFENIQNIFQEASLLTSSGDLQNGGEPNILYDAEKNILHFCNGCVGAQAVMNLHLHLYNSGLVPCEATSIIITSNDSPAFYVTPEKFTIMSHSELVVTLAFRPTQIGVFEEVLEVKVELPSPLKPQVFRTQLIGEAYLPRITVLAPPFPHHLTFPPTLVGDASEETIRFVNSSKINCVVIFEMLTNKNSGLSFYSDSKSLIKGSLHTVHLKTGEGASVVARFCPVVAGRTISEVRLMVTNNPYEDLTLKLEGVGYMQDIVAEGLPLVVNQQMSVKRSSEACLQAVKFELTLPPCSVGDFTKKVFSLKNQTQDFWYRFQWDEVEPIMISPSIGHLPPESSKQLLVTFQSDQPKVVIKNMEISCSLSRIRLENESAVGWDNHQKTIKWTEMTDDPESTDIGANRIRCSREEPQYEELPGSGLSLAVVVSACADFPQVTCPAQDILLPPTIINQIEQQELLVQNSGMVPAQISWIVRDQIQSEVEESAKACYGSVTMSSERPVLQPRLLRKQKVSLRPATCPRVRPGPIPATVAVLSRDDLFIRESSLQLEPRPGVEPRSGWPVSVEPADFRLSPGEQTTCTVKFRPVELARYACELQLRLEDAEPGTLPVSLKVEGSSMLPCCHLVVPGCSPTTNLHQLQIKFSAMGTKKPVIKRVQIVNTTYEDYTFYWREADQDKLSAFGCSKPASKVSPAEHVEVMFSFTPSQTGCYKSTWRLSIPERHVQQDVLLVGEAVQPCVTWSPTFVQLRPTLIDVHSEGRSVLVNHEDCELKFVVDANSLHCSTWGQNLQVQPMKGVIPGQAQIDFRLWLCPTQAGEGHFPVQVAVEKLEKPLKLDVAAQCFSVQPQLVYLDSNKVLHNMLVDRDNSIDIGVVEVRIPVSQTFYLTNIGKPAFHYSCVWSSEEAEKSQLSISVANQTGLVSSQSKQLINVVVTPLTRTVFSKVKLEFVINKGPKYTTFLSGTAAQPQFKFSKTKIDFGACFVLPPDTEVYKTVLVFTNTDEKPLLVETDFDQKPHLKVGLTQAVVEPRSELHIPVIFLPQACQPYQEVLGFLVDGSYRHEFTASGRGVDLNVMLGRPEDKLLQLEGVRVGKVKRRTVEVINNSEASVSASFTLEPALPSLTLSTSDPEGPVTLSPGQSTTLGLAFTPDCVVKGLHQELVLNFQNVRKVLSIVKASSVGVSVKIDRDYLPFGSVVIGDSPTSKLLLSNIGDLAVKFSWKVSDSVFTILPSEGFVSSNTDVVLTVKFSPDKIQPIEHAKAVCTLTGGQQLVITLSGGCVDLPPPSMTIPLSCPVRTTATTQIPVFNKFGQEIKLTANISGEYFSCDSSALIPPYGTHIFEIMYSPLSMTTPSQPHKGTAIFYCVDGTCLVYSLEGTAKEPNRSDRIVTQLVAHALHTLLVPVHNWLQTPQKFRVSHELLSSTVSQTSYQLTCNELFMVSGSQTRDLTLKFICRFPGTLEYKVVLTNESSGDYIWYLVVFDVSSCPPLADIAFDTHVREEVEREVKIHNPLDTPVTIGCQVNVPGLSAVNTPLEVQPLQQGTVKLRYLPLWPSDPSTSSLTLTSKDLGTFPYTVTVTALPAVPASPLCIRCGLGQSASNQLTLHNPTDTETTFQCTSSHEDVSVPATVVAGPNESKAVLVVFQPSSLSEVCCDIVAASPQAGQYLFPVIGTVSYPEPAGPYTLKPGSSRVVSFRNVFREEKTFTLSVDNPAFSVRENKVLLKPSEVAEIKIEMLQIGAKEYPNYPVTGKMSVFADDCLLAHVKWVFYLHGELV